MDRPRSVVNRIDVERVDADKNNAGVDELPCESTSEVRMVFEILIRSPMNIPSGVNKKRFSPENGDVEWQPVDCAITPVGGARNDAIEVG